MTDLSKRFVWANPNEYLPTDSEVVAVSYYGTYASGYYDGNQWYVDQGEGFEKASRVDAWLKEVA